MRGRAKDLTGQLGLSDPTAPLSGERGWYIIRDYAAAFFDLHLRAYRSRSSMGPWPRILKLYSGRGEVADKAARLSEL